MYLLVQFIIHIFIIKKRKSSIGNANHRILIIGTIFSENYILEAGVDRVRIEIDLKCNRYYVRAEN